MNQFWKLMRESVIVQGLLTLIIVSAWLYLMIAGRPVPEMLNTVVGLVVGFYFGSKVQQAINTTKS